MIRDVRGFWASLLIATTLSACPSKPAPETPTPTPSPDSPEGRRAALVEAWASIDAKVTALPGQSDDEAFESCDAIGEQVAGLWAATRRVAIEEALERAEPREGDPVPPASKRKEDDLLVNYTTGGYAELAALAYRLRWGGWRQAGSVEILEHLIGTTGIPLVAIKASCDPYVGEMTATAECHAHVALAASVIGLGHCSD